MKKIFLAVSMLFIFIYIPVCLASAAFTTEEVKKKLNAAYPNIPVDAVSQSPVDGVFEIISGGRIAYFYPEKDILIVGNMIQNGKNITNERIVSLMAEKMKNIPLEKALKIGSGKHTVVEITDPECPYCRRAAEYFFSRSDLTKYIFFLPLTNLHPQSEIKSKYILDAADKEKAYKEMMTGILDTKDWSQYKPSEKAAAWLAEQTAVVEKMGVNSTPTFSIDGHFVGGADIEAFKKILGEPEKVNKKPEAGK